jgi:5-methylcytosine-specific restriction enzyme subunit McrC
MNTNSSKNGSQEYGRIINLYEYANSEPYNGDIHALEGFLDEIWRTRPQQVTPYFDITDEEHYDSSIAAKQKFLTFLRNSHVKSRKYVGIIKYEGQTINLLPKIFFQNNTVEYSENYYKAIHANVLWWLSYCKKIKFPKTKSSLSTIKSNFFEVLIYLFALYTKQALNNCLYQTYTEINNEIEFMKGRLDVNRYISDNLSNGRWHKLACVYDSFEFDNLFNRIVKCVASLLLGTTSNSENKQLLSEIIFILDEVSDVRVTYSDCNKVNLNPLYEDLFTVLDYCKLFLGNSISYSYKDQFQVFAFLLPMEYVFEDFVFGFLEANLDNIEGVRKLKSQKSDLYLAKLYENEEEVKEEVFNLQHDIYFEYKNKKIIADTKYKIIYNPDSDSNNPDYKHGVSQADLYQLVSYAIRRKATDLYLLYPETLLERHDNGIDKSVKFVITDEFADKEIDVNIAKIQIIHHDFPSIDSSKSLQNNFEETDARLKGCLKEIFALNTRED